MKLNGKTISGVIFDSDGTLVNTKNLIIQGYIENLIKHGFEHNATEEHILNCIGGRVSHTLAQLTGLDEDSALVAKMVEQQDKIQDKIANEVITAYPGVEETINSLKDLGVVVGLYTSGSLYQVKRNFLAAGMNSEQLFDAVVTADDHYPSKPNPAGLRECASKLKIKTSRCAYVGDHSVDIECAKKAGFALSAGVSHGFESQKELEDAGADIVIELLADLLA